MSDKLTEILVFCANNKIKFDLYKVDGVNSIEYIESPEKTLIIKIGVIDEKELFTLLNNKIEELKHLFK